MGRIPRICSVLVLGSAFGGTVGSAQHTQVVQGTVVRSVGESTVPVSNVWVVLHRVGRDTAAAVDSVRSDARGRYSIRRAVAEDSAVFFASTAYGGVAYFTPPFRGIDGPAEAATLTVYDTTSSGAAVRTQGRHLVISSVDVNDQRSIVEAFELENTSGRTRVASTHAPSWSTQLPPGAADVHVERGDVPPEAIAVREDRVDAFAAIPPGLRGLVFSYSVPAARFPLTVPVPDTTALLEVLIEQEGATADGAGLVAQEPVTLQGRTFQRFTARNVPAGATFLVVAPVATHRGAGTTIAIVAGLIGVALLLFVARAALGAGGVRAPATPGRVAAQASAQAADRLARAIADLEAKFERRASPTADERAAFEAERKRLNDELTAVLAERDERL